MFKHLQELTGARFGLIIPMGPEGSGPVSKENIEDAGIELFTNKARFERAVLERFKENKEMHDGSELDLHSLHADPSSLHGKQRPVIATIEDAQADSTWQYFNQFYWCWDNFSSADGEFL